ncbi:HNH endonuclease signature motif containing protein [Pseudactinotalea sp. Z1748]|uniref:HNH endonuclease signature motif containing protein n=1 Tax=Pseudactinotalea sp. Z1748 TaxID=3413027 RepID=UPI003C7D7C8F
MPPRLQSSSSPHRYRRPHPSRPRSQPNGEVHLATQHTTCAADGCARPYSWCELHHGTPWEDGGPTDLDNAVPLCHRHHRMAHDHKYHHTRTPTGTYTFTMRH